MANINRALYFSGCVLILFIFFWAGIGKLQAFSGTQAYMASAGVPGGLLPLVIALEILCPIAILIGWHTRWFAYALCGFTLLSAVIFHWDFADRMQSLMFQKNLAIAGGLIFLAMLDRKKLFNPS